MLVLQEGSFAKGDTVIMAADAYDVEPVKGTILSSIKVNNRNRFIINWRYEDGDCEEIHRETDLALVKRA